MIIDLLLLVSCMNSVTVVEITKQERFNICYKQSIIRVCDAEQD